MNGNKDKPYLGTRLISPPILEEITDLHRRLTVDPFYDEEIKQEEIKSLFHESVINSARLEAELLKIQGSIEERYNGGFVSKRQLLDDAREIGDRVEDAWHWATDNFDGKFDERFIGQIGNIVQPDLNPAPALRTAHVKVGDKGAFSPEKLRMYFPVLMDELNNDFVYFDSQNIVHGRENAEEAKKFKITPVEKAAYAHLMTFIMQPLGDGNKRTGRILQNLILLNEKLPPAVIRGTDSEEYIKMLCDAREGFENRRADNSKGATTSNEEHTFYDFVGRRVVDSLHTLEDKIGDKKIYHVVIRGQGPKYEQGVYRMAKQALISLLRKRSPNYGQVRLSEDGLIVKGNISKDDLNAVLDTMPGIKQHDILPVIGHYNKK